MKKTLYTLCVNGFAPEVTALTFPLMQRWADKIGAEFVIIDSRKFEDFPVTYEKFQIFNLAQERNDDWSIFFDADTLIHPDYYDPTILLSKDTTFSNGTDFTPIRFKPNKYFLRDGRYIGKGNWCLAASDWCLDIWRPLDKVDIQDVIKDITPTTHEQACGITAEHLIDDYTVSFNLARFGLKHIISPELEKKHTIPGNLLWHHYLIKPSEKLVNMQRTLMNWLSGVSDQARNIQLANQWAGQTSWGDFLDVGKATELKERIVALGLPL
jgi:hypothetical protein